MNGRRAPLTLPSVDWVCADIFCFFTKFILRRIYISWVLFTDCTKGPRGPSLCKECCSLNLTFHTHTVSFHLLTHAETDSLSCVWLARANLLLQRLLKLKRSAFFPPGVDLSFNGWKSKFQPLSRFSHIMWHIVGIKTVQSTQQKHVHSSAKCSNSMDSIPVHLVMVIHLPYTECLCCWLNIFKVKSTLKKVFTCWQLRERTEIQCNPTHKPINYGHKEYTRRQETKYILQIHLRGTL